MKVYIVSKNADFTEGRGPMIAILVFSCVTEAETYVVSQPGIYGSKQYTSPTEYPKTPGKWHYNGYDIEEKEVHTTARDVMINERMASLSPIIESLENHFEKGNLTSKQVASIRKILAEH